jgi:hypothetical protein
MIPALQWNLASKLHFRESPIAPSHARMLPTAHDHTELEQSLGVVAWLEEGRDLGDDPRRSPRSDNGPLSLALAIAFRAARPTPPCEPCCRGCTCDPTVSIGTRRRSRIRPFGRGSYTMSADATCRQIGGYLKSI